jgi:hypothetical protein
MKFLGNIAEVPELRKDLIRTETIRFYTEALTESGESSLEVAYNACGTLSHLMSDTSTPWPDSLLGIYFKKINNFSFVHFVERESALKGISNKVISRND